MENNQQQKFDTKSYIKYTSKIIAGLVVYVLVGTYIQYRYISVKPIIIGFMALIPIILIISFLSLKYHDVFKYMKYMKRPYPRQTDDSLEINKTKEEVSKKQFIKILLVNIGTILLSLWFVYLILYVTSCLLWKISIPGFPFEAFIGFVLASIITIIIILGTILSQVKIKK